MAHTYTYDQFGRLTKKTDGTYTADYYYHYGDKLTKVASNYLGEGTVTYTYGGDQKRRSRAVSGGDTIQYRYDRGWNVVNEEDGSGTLETTYVHSPVRQIGTVLATSSGSTASSGTFAYYFQDAIGSTRGLWDNSGDRLGKYDYTPFGGKYAEHGEDITRKFTGHDWDSETRLYYTAYRYYSPDSNRWLTRDPLGMVDGPNVYAYVMGNPVSFFDALGRSVKDDFLRWFGGHRGDTFDRISEFMGRCVGGAALLMLLALFPLIPMIHGTALVGSGSVAVYGAGITTPTSMTWLGGVVGFQSIGYGSIGSVFTGFTSLYSVGLAGLGFISEIFDLIDMPFSYYTDIMMGANSNYSCKDVLTGLFKFSEEDAQDLLACGA